MLVNVNCRLFANIVGIFILFTGKDVYKRQVMGIVNGTTNFILTKMSQENMEFKDALALATELGYAEADPTADIDGLDAGRKVAILASVAFNSRVVFDDVYIEGITKISAKDIRYAKEMGCAIKLLGVARNTESGVEAYVLSLIHIFSNFIYFPPHVV